MTVTEVDAQVQKAPQAATPPANTAIKSVMKPAPAPEPSQPQVDTVVPPLSPKPIEAALTLGQENSQTKPMAPKIANIAAVPKLNETVQTLTNQLALAETPKSPMVVETKVPPEQNDADKTAKQIKTIYRNQADQLEEFRNSCGPKMREISEQISSLDSAKRRILKKRNDTVQDSINRASASYITALKVWKGRFLSVQSSDLPGLQSLLEEITKESQTMTSQREQFIIELDAIRAAASNPSK